MGRETNKTGKEKKIRGKKKRPSREVSRQRNKDREVGLQGRKRKGGRGRGVCVCACVSERR